MIITILFLLISNTVADDIGPGETYKYERIQGQCQAWCYQTYGTWKETPINDPETEYIYQCLKKDSRCHAFDAGCLHVCKYKNNVRCQRECTADCGALDSSEACVEGCTRHRNLAEAPFNITEYNKDLQRAFPEEIYRLPENRTTSSLGVRWNHMNMFTNNTAVLFLLFLSNVTTTTYNESAESEVIYLGSTPHYSFVAKNLSPKYCYHFKMLTVTPDDVVGTSQSIDDSLTVEAEVTAYDITATSVKLSFPIRPCERETAFTLYILPEKTTDFKLIPEKIQIVSGNQSEDTYTGEQSHLLPNTAYLVQAKPDDESFSWSGEFKTLLMEPDTPGTITEITDITATTITYWLEVQEEKRMWNSDAQYFTLKVNGTRIPLEYPARGMALVEGLLPYTTYCVQVAVANEVGLGPYSKQQQNCTRTESAAASKPRVVEVSKTAEQLTLNVTRPDQENGLLLAYKLEYLESDKLITKECAISPGPVTQCRLEEGLDAHTDYKISVQANNSLGMLGEKATIIVRTHQSLPDGAPTVKTCLAKMNNTHATLDVTWERPDEDLINGEITQYMLSHEQKVVDSHSNSSTMIYNNTVNITDWHDSKKMIEVASQKMKIQYRAGEKIVVKLAVATVIGSGPWSTEFECDIETRPDAMPISQILIPVFCVVALFLLLILGFFYFFRFKTYKKTPYEEIAKLINPDAFSPCQHCMHNKEPKRWDVFICHVSEDIDYIFQLKEAFVREKIDVFFAKDELSWGCELHKVINDGLRYSKYGLVVLSKQFVEKCSKWTSTELSSLHSKSRLSSQDCILPVWKKDITELEVGDFDMTLVGIKALKEEEMTVDQMAIELKKKLRNDGCWGCNLRKPQSKTPKSKVVVYEDGSSPDDSGYTISIV